MWFTPSSPGGASRPRPRGIRSTWAARWAMSAPACAPTATGRCARWDARQSRSSMSGRYTARMSCLPTPPTRAAIPPGVQGRWHHHRYPRGDPVHALCRLRPHPALRPAQAGGGAGSCWLAGDGAPGGGGDGQGHAGRLWHAPCGCTGRHRPARLAEPLRSGQRRGNARAPRLRQRGGSAPASPLRPQAAFRPAGGQRTRPAPGGGGADSRGRAVHRLPPRRLVLPPRPARPHRSFRRADWAR